MIPIILCGGYSRRMGEDKGLMQWNGNPMVSTILKTLENHFEIAPKLSIRKEQEIEYIEKLTKYQFVIDDPHLNIGGPLKGILSVHKNFPKEDLFLIACDMPLISNEIIIKIKTAFTENGSKEIIVCKHGHRIEPLCE